MNPLEALNLVENAITICGCTPGKVYDIYLENNQFTCVPASNTYDFDFFIATLTGSDLHKGLTTRQWNKIEARIADLAKEGKICLEHLKP